MYAMPDHTPLSIGGESSFEFSDGLTCFPSADCVSIAEGNGQNACSAWVWDRPVRALSAYAYQKALPLVRANQSRGRWLKLTLAMGVKR